MAGFFGLFDYSKPGPGVKKDGPKKKGFVVFFEIYFRKFWKLIVGNLLFVLVALPVVTTGLANAGLCYLTRNFAREKHAFVAGDFFDTIKKNWKQALPAGVINLIVSGLLLFNIAIFSFPEFFQLQIFQSQTTNLIFLAINLSLWSFFSFMKYYIYMIMITFKLKLKHIYKNSAILAIAGLKRNILIFFTLGLFYMLLGLIAYWNLYLAATVAILFYIFLFPAFRSLLIQYNVFPVIKRTMIDPYYRDHPGEDLEAKRALNIEDEDDQEREKEEPVFQDTIDEPEPPANTFPRQYTEQEMARLRRRQRRSGEADRDDDGTI